LLWCRWAVQQAGSVYPSIVRSNLAFSYFLPYRAFADFFTMNRYKDPKTGDVDVHAVDFSDYDRYENSRWKARRPHMNTHLFHINYSRVRNTTPFDSTSVIDAIHPEFEANWKNFIDNLRDDFPRLFKEHIDSRRRAFPYLILYP
jgi:hypothetical protein